eukprot:m.31480 g.31480  ORF g.31480 m.31480 type:complete len:216 (+) comp12076_c0_seq1:78-725(+)
MMNKLTKNDYSLFTSLYWACAKDGSLPQLQDALSRIPDSELRRLINHHHAYRRYTPLHAAVCSNTNTIDCLLNAGALVNARAEHRTTPLHLACELGDTAAADKLLRHGANVNARARATFSRADATPLHIACNQGNAVELVQLLIAFGSPIEVQDANTKRTALHLACSAGNFEAAEALVQKGADIKARDRVSKLQDRGQVLDDVLTGAADPFGSML